MPHEEIVEAGKGCADGGVADLGTAVSAFCAAGYTCVLSGAARLAHAAVTGGRPPDLVPSNNGCGLHCDRPASRAASEPRGVAPSVLDAHAPHVLDALGRAHDGKWRVRRRAIRLACVQHADALCVDGGIQLNAAVPPRDSWDARQRVRQCSMHLPRESNGNNALLACVDVVPSAHHPVRGSAGLCARHVHLRCREVHEKCHLLADGGEQRALLLHAQ
mmetsp:Transcript_24105/g.65233  ORF Transcript_24105/g.65233 Transcript_24105/m.65233 type:complete len:218 (+) Transcript_24105:509-1162(+)